VTMQVRVVRRGSLKEAGAAAVAAVVELPDDATVDDVMPVGLAPGACLVLINGAMARRGARVKDGDRIELYGQTAGG
jgi:hypothetical protein